jgi:predicted N-formylglutamate amidohydrolase
MIDRAMSLPASIPGIADVELLRGGDAQPGPLALVVEVPHGADHADYEAVRAQLGGPVPDDLDQFFSVNTDVGAWQLGLRVAERIVAADPRRTALAIRCRVPRTFIDCNRIEDAAEGDLAAGGMTASVPAYVRDPGDRARLLALHRQYVALVGEAHAALDPAGFLLLPHTYGPRTLGIDSVGDDIVDKLRWAHEPDRVETWPLRAEVDLITRSQDGAVTAALDVADEVAAAYRSLGVGVAENAAYHIHPSTLAHTWAQRLPGRVFCLEVRRDLLVERWTWNAQNRVLAPAVDRFAAPIASAIDGWLRRANRPHAAGEPPASA